ncbi:deaminase, partial [Enterococcus faecalis]
RDEAVIPYLGSLELSLTERGNHLIDLELPHVATASRTHVDVEPMTDLRYIDEVQALAQTKPIAVEIVDFPQHGLLR